MLRSRPWEGPSPGTVTLRSLKALDTHIMSHVRGKSLVCSPIYIPSKQARLGWLVWEAARLTPTFSPRGWLPAAAGGGSWSKFIELINSFSPHTHTRPSHAAPPTKLDTSTRFRNPARWRILEGCE